MSGTNETRFLKDLRENLLEKLKALKGLPDNEKESKGRNIKDMIRYYKDLSDKIEDKREKVHSFSLQILAISVAGLGLVIAQKTVLHQSEIGKNFFEAVVLSIIVLIITAVLSTIFYYFQTWFRYPFLNLDREGFQAFGNKWKWFYYGNEEILKINTNPFVLRQKKVRESLKPYLKGFEYFLSNYINEDLNSEIIEDITQLYLLQVHNYYKNRFHLQLTKIWLLAFCVIFSILLISIAVRLV